VDEESVAIKLLNGSWSITLIPICLDDGIKLLELELKTIDSERYFKFLKTSKNGRLIYEERER